MTFNDIFKQSFLTSFDTGDLSLRFILTALAVNLGEMGIVLSISRQRDQIKRQEVIL